MSQSHALTPPTAFKLGESVANQYLPASEQFAAYADNFDLSLLPQDNIPTTVSQYSNSLSDNTNVDVSKQQINNIQPPQIKIEQSWCNLDLDLVKQEHDFLNSCEQTQPVQQQQQLQQQLLYTKSQNQLIPPPPAYPHSYPSPQSSPAQSDYSATFACAQFNGCYDSLGSSRTSLYASSPCPSLDTTCIKQELHILPPSPPESNCETPSPRSACNESIKAEPIDADVERLTDLNTLLDKSYAAQQVPSCGTHSRPTQQQPLPLGQTSELQDHQVLREYLADNSFQKKHNLKPLALESFIGGLAEAPGDFEPVISLALEHAKREADATCAELQISRDPSAWTPPQVHAWLRATIAQFELSPCTDLAANFCENGAALLQLSEEEFIRRLPESGSTLHAQLEIWKVAYADGYQQQLQQQCTTTIQTTTMINGNNNNNNNQNDNHISDVTMHMQPIPQYQQQELWQSNYLQNMRDWQEESEDEDEEMPTQSQPELPTGSVSDVAATATNTAAPTTQPAKRSGGARNGGSHIHLWQFLKELLAAPHLNGTAIRWIDRSKGIFKIEDSVRVAKLWGRRKNRPAMNYDKLSRSIRQYYKKGIMKKTERSQRLVYQFCHPYHQ